ncbi:MAG TPA: adenylosuccinate synthase [Sedimentisphaerales bacterium]|nr:adenylosuccinate synthase [Sedimentisphaerales bacterium]
MNWCVAGLQWGDEGKGKVVDILAEHCDIVVRYAGGANAGHTVVIGETRFALHLLPSGSVRDDITCVIGNGVVVDPEVLLGEIAALQSRGISLSGRLFISEFAHVVLDYHKAEDKFREGSLGDMKIGTTARGIGPCYADKVGRSYAVRMADFRNLDRLREKIANIVSYKNRFLGCMYNAAPISADELFEKCRLYAARLSEYIANTTEYLHTSIAAGKNVLFEGAQGSMLDLDHGTFPYVTSSSSSALGVSTGCGVPAKLVGRFLGVIKAYTTRVGEGPFPTELANDIGQYIRDRGHEYGTTTGRPRRCGWFDAMVVKYSGMLGGVDELAMMHLDTLAGLKELKVCTGYKLDGRTIGFFPANLDVLGRVECVYETLKGWDEDLTGIRNFEALPPAAREYVELIESATGIHIGMIGIGPKRSQVIYRAAKQQHDSRPSGHS